MHTAHSSSFQGPAPAAAADKAWAAAGVRGAGIAWEMIATHEAGHAIAAVVEGVSFSRAVLHGEHQGYIDADQDVTGFAGAVVLLAGSAAESRRYGTPFTAHRPGRDADFHRAEALVDSETHTRAMYRAFAIVDNCTTAIERVASALLERGELSKTDVMNLVRS